MKKNFTFLFLTMLTMLFCLQNTLSASSHHQKQNGSNSDFNSNSQIYNDVPKKVRKSIESAIKNMTLRQKLGQMWDYDSFLVFNTGDGSIPTYPYIISESGIITPSTVDINTIKAQKSQYLFDPNTGNYIIGFDANNNPISPFGSMFCNDSEAFCSGVGTFIASVRQQRTFELGNIDPSLFVLLMSDSYTGIMGYGNPQFPSLPALTNSFDLDLITQVANAQAAMNKAVGINMIANPVCDTKRNPNWGRFRECASESPLVGGEVVSTWIKGVQSMGVSACVKHFMGYGYNHGIDRMNNEVSWKNLREIDMPVYAAGISAGCWSVMSQGQILVDNLIPGQSNFISDILRGKLGFTGMLISDYADVNTINDKFNMGPANTDGIEGVEAFINNTGCQFIQGSPILYSTIKKLLKEGKVSKSAINNAVRRILVLKWRTGLLNYQLPSTTVAEAAAVVIGPDGQGNYRNLMRQAAGESVVVLKNQNNILPVTTPNTTLFVTGPTADCITAAFGTFTVDWYQDWFDSWYFAGVPAATSNITNLDGTVGGGQTPFVSIRQGLQYYPAPGVSIINGVPYYTNADPFNFYGTTTPLNSFGVIPDWDTTAKSLKGKFVYSDADIANVVSQATISNPTYLVVCLGETIAPSENNGDAFYCHGDTSVFAGLPDTEVCGTEPYTGLELPTDQVKLVQALSALNIPIIGIFQGGRPLIINKVEPYLSAFIYADELGTETGSGIADVLYGRLIPSSRLNFNWPKTNSGAGLTHHEDAANSQLQNKIFQQYNFGDGLTYNDIIYNNFSASITDHLNLSVDVINQSSTGGYHTVLFFLYMQNWSKPKLGGQLTRLVGFKRVFIPGNGTVSVNIRNDLSILGSVDTDSINDQHKTPLKVLAGEYVFSTVNLDSLINYQFPNGPSQNVNGVFLNPPVVNNQYSQYVAPTQSGLVGNAQFIGQEVAVKKNIKLRDYCMFQDKDKLNDL